MPAVERIDSAPTGTTNIATTRRACEHNLLILICLLSLLQGNRHLQRLSAAHHSNFHDVADFAPAQCVREVEKVGDGLVAKLNEDIARLKSGFGCRRTGTNAGEWHTLCGFSK